MPLQKLQFRPGLNREGTDYSNEGGWFDGDKIRFRSGYPEKIGGWTRMSNAQFVGTARSLWNWIDLGGTNYLGIGTSKKYYIETGGSFSDVTPIVQTDTNLLGGVLGANPISTAFSTLNGDISASATSLVLTSGASFPTSGIILIGTEKILYTGKSTNTLTGLTRGYDGTTAASHLTGANVGCYTVTITDAAYIPGVGDYILISTSAAVGGITVAPAWTSFTEYVVQSVDVPNTKYTINCTTASTSAASGGGTVYIQYELPIGLDIYIPGTGWGAGPWGVGGWGSPYLLTTLGRQLRLWSNDNFGENLVIAPRGGAIYYWQDSLGVGYRAEPLADLSTAAGFDGQYVPLATNQVIASAIQRFVIALGSNPYESGNPNTVFDPMLVRWSDQENPYEWVPAVTNQSGEFRLTNGSFIMSGRATRQEILVWTDSALYSMQYLGPPYVWGFQVLMDNISVMSPNSMITVQNVTYWMGTDKFYMYSGRVETLPCALRQYIFNDINKNQSFQVFAGGNEGYNEVWWFYCSQGSNTVDKYVIYNYLDRVWYYGSLARTAWLDSGIRPYPMAANYENRILYHESAVDDVSGLSAVPINAYVQSSDFDIGDGHNFGFVWRILPDVNFNGSNVNGPYVTMTVKPRRNSGTAYGVSDNPTVESANNYQVAPAYTIQEFTGQVYTRLRGRQMSFRIESDSLGVAWQLGSPRLDIRNDGRR